VRPEGLPIASEEQTDETWRQTKPAETQQAELGAKKLYNSEMEALGGRAGGQVLPPEAVRSWGLTLMNILGKISDPLTSGRDYTFRCWEPLPCCDAYQLTAGEWAFFCDSP
jgi:hypothetical protein